MANNDLGYIPVRIGQIAHEQSWWDAHKDLILIEGELGINTTDDTIYIGDGLSTWEHCKKIITLEKIPSTGTKIIDPTLGPQPTIYMSKYIQTTVDNLSKDTITKLERVEYKLPSGVFTVTAEIVQDILQQVSSTNYAHKFIDFITTDSKPAQTIAFGYIIYSFQEAAILNQLIVRNGDGSITLWNSDGTFTNLNNNTSIYQHQYSDGSGNFINLTMNTDEQLSSENFARIITTNLINSYAVVHGVYAMIANMSIDKETDALNALYYDISSNTYQLITSSTVDINNLLYIQR